MLLGSGAGQAAVRWPCSSGRTCCWLPMPVGRTTAQSQGFAAGTRFSAHEGLYPVFHCSGSMQSLPALVGACRALLSLVLSALNFDCLATAPVSQACKMCGY